MATLERTGRLGLALVGVAALGAIGTARVRADEPPPPAQTSSPAVHEAPATADTPPSAAPPAPAGSTAEEDAAADLDPTRLVFFNLRLQHDELGDGNAVDLVLLRRDVAIPRPRSWPKRGRLALLRFDLPAGNARLGGESTDGIGDLYWHALHVRPVNPRLNLAAGVAFQIPTATEDALGAGKWQVAPTLIQVWRLPGRATFFTKFQDFASFAGDDDRRDVHYLTVNPTYFKILPNRKFLLFDTEGIADWERNRDVSWKSGLLVGTVLRHSRALWLKLEVPWGEHRRSDWSLEASVAFRGRR